MWGGTVARFETSLCASARRHVEPAKYRAAIGSARRLPPWQCALDPSGLKSLRMTSCLGNLLEPTRFHKAEYQRVVPNLHLN